MYVTHSGDFSFLIYATYFIGGNFKNPQIVCFLGPTLPPKVFHRPNLWAQLSFLKSPIVQDRDTLSIPAINKLFFLGNKKLSTWSFFIFILHNWRFLKEGWAQNFLDAVYAICIHCIQKMYKSDYIKNILDKLEQWRLNKKLTNIFSVLH